MSHNYSRQSSVANRATKLLVAVGIGICAATASWVWQTSYSSESILLADNFNDAVSLANLAHSGSVIDEVAMKVQKTPEYVKKNSIVSTNPGGRLVHVFGFGQSAEDAAELSRQLSDLLSGPVGNLKGALLISQAESGPTEGGWDPLTKGLLATAGSALILSVVKVAPKFKRDDALNVA